MFGSPAGHSYSTRRGIPAIALTAAMLLAVGCMPPSPFEDHHPDQTLRDSVLESVRRELEDARSNPDLQETRPPEAGEALPIRPEFMEKLRTMAGMESYNLSHLSMDADLLGHEQRTVALNLEYVIRSAVANNLNVQFARIAPAVTESQVVSAEAAFDWVLFANTNYSKTDQPRTTQQVGATTFGVASDRREVFAQELGVRRLLTSGATLTVQGTYTFTDIQTPGLSTAPNPANQGDFLLQLDQPLLRGFGSDVALAQIRITRNAERDAIQSLKRDLIRVVTETEASYWTLVQAHRDLLILQRLLKRGVEVRDQVKARIGLDATQAELSDVVARVEQRRANIIRAQNAMRQASDQLKLRMSDPDLPVGSEILLVPIDVPVAEPIAYSLVGTLLTALDNRPEIQQAILSIDDSSIRQLVADNQRLPQLDLRLQAQWHALSDQPGPAFEDVFSGHFIDYLVGFEFERPFGNRAAEATYRQRRLERTQAVIAYKNTIEQVTLEVKTSLRNVATNYSLIEQSTKSRLAAAENLRTLEVRKDTMQIDIQLLDLELRRQDALANAEREEVRALTTYNSSLADLYSAMGTTLDRNQIDFVVPDVRDLPEIEEPR